MGAAELLLCATPFSARRGGPSWSGGLWLQLIMGPHYLLTYMDQVFYLFAERGLRSMGSGLPERCPLPRQPSGWPRPGCSPPGLDAITVRWVLVKPGCKTPAQAHV